MKVIFLDVDGVLNSASFAKKMRKEEGFDPIREGILDPMCLSMLKRIVQETDAEIVLTSTWRLFHGDKKRLVEQLEDYDLRIYSETPSTCDYRGDEIQAWIYAHPYPIVSSFVILDDDKHLGSLIHRLVQTSFDEWGLRYEHVKRAVDILNHPENYPVYDRREPIAI